METVAAATRAASLPAALTPNPKRLCTAAVTPTNRSPSMTRSRVSPELQLHAETIAAAVPRFQEATASEEDRYEGDECASTSTTTSASSSASKKRRRVPDNLQLPQAAAALPPEVPPGFPPRTATRQKHTPPINPTISNTSSQKHSATPTPAEFVGRAIWNKLDTPLHGAIARITKRYQKRIQRATKAILATASSTDEAEDIKTANYIQRNAEIAEYLKQYGIAVEHHGELGSTAAPSVVEDAQPVTPPAQAPAPPTPPTPSLSLESSISGASPVRSCPPQPPAPPANAQISAHTSPPPILEPRALTHTHTHTPHLHPEPLQLERLKKSLEEARAAANETRNIVTTVQFTRKHSPATSAVMDVQIAQMENFIMTVERFAAALQGQIDELVLPNGSSLSAHGYADRDGQAEGDDVIVNNPGAGFAIGE